MKKIYIKPSVSVYSAVLESCLLTGSGSGLDPEQNWNGGSCAPKRIEITDDSSDDTFCSESESLWD